MKDLKKRVGLALTSCQRATAASWAKKHGVSISTVACAAIGILGKIPLSAKELIVEVALREALGAQPSASEAQLSRRQESSEAAIAALRADVDELRRKATAAQVLEDASFAIKSKSAKGFTPRR
jgi:uncharacterized membrane protein YcjF (UPF0283 family)